MFYMNPVTDIPLRTAQTARATLKHTKMCIRDRELTAEEDLTNINRILDLLDADDDVQEVFHNWDE